MNGERFDIEIALAGGGFIECSVALVDTVNGALQVYQSDEDTGGGCDLEIAPGQWVFWVRSGDCDPRS